MLAENPLECALRETMEEIHIAIESDSIDENAIPVPSGKAVIFTCNISKGKLDTVKLPLGSVPISSFALKALPTTLVTKKQN